MSYLFTSESVSEGHPDKVSDQISDALLDAFLKHDPNSRVACETLVTTGLVVLSGEVKTTAYIDIPETAREVIKNIGYTKQSYRFDHNSCGILTTIHEQAADIGRGVDRGVEEEMGAGDQGMMFGYATNEMDNFMPLPIEIAHRLVQDLAAIRREGKAMHYLAPDSKSQVTIEYDENKTPIHIKTIVVSTQHDDFDKDHAMVQKIEEDIRNYLIPRVMMSLPQKYRKLYNEKTKVLVNQTGRFVIGGPHGDTGLTGRKIIVDTYGGKGAHGGGAFSGKDPSKVDRSAAYAARHIAKNIVAAGIADEALIQLAYVIGVKEPVGFYLNTYGTAKVSDKSGVKLTDDKIAEVVKKLWDLRPFAIIKRFGLKNPIYLRTASYGHFGRDPKVEKVEVFYQDQDTFTEYSDGKMRTFKNVEFFSWEKIDEVARLKKAFGLK